MKRYRFMQSSGDRAHETWVWVTWIVLLFMTIASGFGLMGYVAGKSEERAYFLPLVSGMVKQVDDKCTSTPWKKRELKPGKKEIER